MNVGVLILLFSAIFSCDHMDEMRYQYHQIDSEEKLEAFIKRCESSSCSEAKAYLAVATMQKAEYAFLPTSKLKYFNRGKKQLEEIVAADNNNIEARYLRLLVQTEVPKFIGYNKEIASDLKFVSEHLDASMLSEKTKALFRVQINRIKKEK